MKENWKTEEERRKGREEKKTRKEWGNRNKTKEEG